VTEKQKIHEKNDAVYRCKSEQDTAFEELYRNDKNLIRLPRQTAYRVYVTMAICGKTQQIKANRAQSKRVLLRFDND